MIARARAPTELLPKVLDRAHGGREVPQPGRDSAASRTFLDNMVPQHAWALDKPLSRLPCLFAYRNVQGS